MYKGNILNKIEKPKFFTTPIWGNVSIALGIIIAFSFSQTLSDIVLFVIVIGLVILFFIWNLIKYLITYHKLYKNYLLLYETFNELERRHSALAIQFDNKKIQIDELYSLLDEYEFIMNNILYNLQQSILPINNYEKEYLKGLYSIVYRDLEHIYRMKGDLKNGKDL